MLDLSCCHLFVFVRVDFANCNNREGKRDCVHLFRLYVCSRNKTLGQWWLQIFSQSDSSWVIRYVSRHRYIAMHAYIYACIYVSMYVCMFECMYVCMYVCFFIYFLSSAYLISPLTHTATSTATTTESIMTMNLWILFRMIQLIMITWLINSRHEMTLRPCGVCT